MIFGENCKPQISDINKGSDEIRRMKITLFWEYLFNII